MLQSYPNAATAPRLAVRVIRGWDIGVAWGTSEDAYVKTPAEWREDLGR